MQNLKQTLTWLGVLATLVAVAQAQTPAFPGALGFGANATGGRNGTVYHVTTLADSGPGSFRDAVSGGNRTVVFDVGGYITLSSAVSCNANLTIAGQTAPGGIGFRGGKISFGSRNNIICRFIRIRPGSETASNEDVGLSVYNARHQHHDDELPDREPDLPAVWRAHREPGRAVVLVLQHLRQLA
jgi:pectate lyase